MSDIKFTLIPTKAERSRNRLKWKDTLKEVERVFNNRWIYRIFLDWGTVTKQGFVPLHSNINIKECVLVHDMISRYRPKRVLEIGCAMGVSGMVIVNALGRYCPDGSLVSVDPFQDTQWGSIGLNNIRKAIKHCKAKHDVTHMWVKMLSVDYWKRSSVDGPLDMVFIDGDHSFEGCLLDILGAHKYLKNGGMVIIDDVLHPGPRKAIRETLDGNLKSSYKLHPDSLTTMSVFIKRA